MNNFLVLHFIKNFWNVKEYGSNFVIVIKAEKYFIFHIKLISSWHHLKPLNREIKNWTCAKPKLLPYWTKMCSSDNGATMFLPNLTKFIYNVISIHRRNWIVQRIKRSYLMIKYSCRSVVENDWDLLRIYVWIRYIIYHRCGRQKMKILWRHSLLAHLRSQHNLY